MSSDYNGIKLEISNKDVPISGTSPNISKLYNICLNIPWVEKEFRKRIKPLNGMRMEIKICVIQLKQ